MDLLPASVSSTLQPLLGTVLRLLEQCHTQKQKEAAEEAAAAEEESEEESEDDEEEEEEEDSDEGGDDVDEGSEEDADNEEDARYLAMLEGMRGEGFMDDWDEEASLDEDEDVRRCSESGYSCILPYYLLALIVVRCMDCAQSLLEEVDERAYFTAKLAGAHRI